MNIPKQSTFSATHLLFFFFFFMFHLPVYSWGEEWDGVIVTQADFQTLQALKQDLIDPEGFLRSWNDSGLNACSGGWEGIKCSLGQVIVIQLPWRGLSGKISDAIGQLQSLRKLSLHDNSIGGPIPSTLGLIPSLRGLQLYNNAFTGSIPFSLSNCLVLQSLDLGNNALTGEIPPDIADSPNLLVLNASFNQLNGTIPAKLFASSTLIILALQSNKNLRGSLPGEIPGNSSLKTLDISNNSLTGEIPFSFTNLSSIEDINLGKNSIHGGIPVWVDQLKELKTLDLSQNNFSGEIPNTLGNIKNLTTLDVSYNSLSGSVPSSLSQKFNSTSFVGNLLLCNFTGGPICSVSPSLRKKRRKLNTKDILLIAGGAFLLFLIIASFLVCCFCKKKKSTNAEKREKKASVTETGEAGGKLVHFDGPIVYTADDLLCATAEILGKSTYGTVYKATLEDGNQVAVKRLREKITKSQTDFEAEANSLAKIRHPNLLALRAYYVGPKGEKFVVYDYMSKGSLATFLHARGPERRIEWAERLKIIKGVARGVMHLHMREGMAHGNLTSSNVLLDEEGNAKVGDYGLAKLMKGAVSGGVMATSGALGYRAPEMGKGKKGTFKGDVYSLGVIALEILTGKAPSEVMNGVDLPQMVASVVKEEWTNEVFDVELMREAPVVGDQLLNTLKVALHCVDPSPAARPDVTAVVQQLDEITPLVQEAKEVGESSHPSADVDSSTLD